MQLFLTIGSWQLSIQYIVLLIWTIVHRRRLHVGIRSIKIQDVVVSCDVLDVIYSCVKNTAVLYTFSNTHMIVKRQQRKRLPADRSRSPSAWSFVIVSDTRSLSSSSEIFLIHIRINYCNLNHSNDMLCERGGWGDNIVDVRTTIFIENKSICVKVNRVFPSLHRMHCIIIFCSLSKNNFTFIDWIRIIIIIIHFCFLRNALRWRRIQNFSNNYSPTVHFYLPYKTSKQSMYHRCERPKRNIFRISVSTSRFRSPASLRINDLRKRWRETTRTRTMPVHEKPNQARTAWWKKRSHGNWVGAQGPQSWCR